MGEPETAAQVLTLTTAIAAGGFLMVIARRFKVPAIVLLLLGGFGLGPQGWGLVQPDSLGDLLQAIVGLAVALILFEGGLTLNLQGYRAVGITIRRLLTIGALITWLVTSGLIWAFYRFPPSLCLLAGSLVIVTGPTVIQPILKRIRLKWNLHNILHWEGVLIDPIGVFIAVMAFEWAVAGGGEQAIGNLALRLVTGLFIGLAGGELIYRLLRWIPDEMINVFSIAGAVGIFGIAEAVIAESGLLSVTVAGLLVGAHQPPSLRAIKDFKAVITDLLIGLLFILLVARLDIGRFFDFGLHGLLFLGVFLLVVRPLVILASTAGQGFKMGELIFLSWVAPRGVVAASMASLFTLALEPTNPNAHFLETFTYSVIVATVVLQGFSAAPLAHLLRLQQVHPDGWLIVGAHLFGRKVAAFIRDEAGVPVALTDSNRAAIDEALKEGLPAFQADAREVEAIERRPEMRNVGNLLAITDNEDLNELLCARWRDALGKEYVHRWSSGKSGLMRARSATSRSVWTWMPRPGIVSGELTLGDASLLTFDSGAASAKGSIVPVALVADGKVMMDPDPKTKLRPGKGRTRLLCLQRESDPLLAALQPELLLRVQAGDRPGLFRTLIHHVAQAVPGIEEAPTLAAVIEREDQMPSNLGHGVAMPHARLRGLDHMVCAIAQLTHPLEWEGGEPVRIVFLLLSPEDEAGAHLAVLGEIARLMSDKATRDELMNASNLPRMIQLIQDRRRKPQIIKA